MNNDLISRNDLEKFKILPFDKASYDDTEINAAYQNGWNDAIDRIIDNAPTVETDIEVVAKDAYEQGYTDGWKERFGEPEERSQGEWIVLVDADNIQTCKCSICGRMADIANREFDKFPYCHCGAKMKGGAE